MLILILGHDNFHTYSNWFIIHKSFERSTLYLLSYGERYWTAIVCLVSVQLFLWSTGHTTDSLLQKLADICSYFTVIVAAVTTHPLLHSSQIWRFFLHWFLRQGKYHLHDSAVRIVWHLRFSQWCLVQYEVCLHFPVVAVGILSRTCTKSLPSVCQQTDCGL
jgi:hypothetical protein